MKKSFSYKNTAASEVTVTPVAIAPCTNYARTEDEVTSCVLKNRTCDFGQGELISFQCSPVKNISSKQGTQYPAKVTTGIQYVIRLDELLRTSDDNGNIIQDDPIVMYLTVRHPNSSSITADDISEVFKRLLGTIVRADGSFRFDDLMLSALVPTTN